MTVIAVEEDRVPTALEVMIDSPLLEIARVLVSLDARPIVDANHCVVRATAKLRLVNWLLTAFGAPSRACQVPAHRKSLWLCPIVTPTGPRSGVQTHIGAIRLGRARKGLRP